MPTAWRRLRSRRVSRSPTTFLQWRSIEQEIQLVLVNILQEALDVVAAGTTPGQLRIAAVSGSGAVQLTISHDGADTTSNPDREVAWQVSEALVAGHGGTLARTVDGASITLPLAVTVAVSRDAASESPTRLGAAAVHVLVLDDERSIGMLLEKWLRSSGYEATVATSGDEAVRLVREIRFDAVLCDHRMAGMTGTEVFDAIVAVHPELGRRFVFMSGDVLNPELREFVERRGIGLLAKPFDRDTVRSTLESVLAEASRQPG